MKNTLLYLWFFAVIAFITLGFSVECYAGKSETVLDVKDFGAKGDGVTNDQIAIQKAVDACNGKPCTVYLANGKFLSGQIRLTNNITLHIDSTAVLLGIQSDSEDAYPHGLINTQYPNRMKDDCQRRLIYGDRVKNVKITGGGTIDGQGDFEPWMNVKELGTEKDRPSILAFVSSQNITVSDITLIEPACWTQVYIDCDSVTIRNVKVNTGHLTPNRDGIDIVDCHRVLIEDCDIKSEDDGICFKSGSERGCRDVIVRRCVLDKLNVRAGNCFKFGTDGLGSFMNFEISELVLKNAFQNSCIAIESMDGAIIDNINIRNCELSNSGQAFFIILADRGRTVPGRKKRIGSISNIHIENIRGSGFTQSYPSIITGIAGHNIQNVTFKNIQLELKGGIDSNDQTVMEYDGNYPEGSKFGDTNAYGFYVRHVDNISFENCEISTKDDDKREWLVEEDVKNVIIKKVE